ncbi:MAG: efflux RND transporter periplasmic adaptor subunit [Frankia sp.]|nr:efflux RND transporter periplasmic adaptor subunit [Frankia sp.]
MVGSLPPQLQGAAAAALAGGGGGQTASSAVAPGVPVAGGAIVATVFDTSTLSLVAEVDETDIDLVRPGVAARAELDAFPGAQYLARVNAVDLSAATSARGGVSYRVRLALGGGRLSTGEAAPRPRPGMSAVVDLQVRNARGVVTVPAAAIVRDGARDAVWVVVGGRAVRRVVTVGAQGAELVQIRRGLVVGERVVVHGADSVRAGQRVG